MKIKYLLCVSLVAVLFLSTGFARADVLYSCDFESPTYILDDSLVGQDGWDKTIYSPPYLTPMVGTGTGENTSNTLIPNAEFSTTTLMTSAAVRDFSTPLTFDSTNTDLEFRFWAKTDKVGAGDSDDHANLALGMMWEGMDIYRELHCGIYFDGGHADKLQVYFRDGKKTMFHSDTLEPGHWYEVKAVMDLSQVCSDGETYGKLDFWYRDVTAGDTEEEFTLDSLIRDKDMFLKDDGNGEFHSNGIYAHEQVYQTYGQDVFIDNISIIDPVPEPSTLALLATGLLGLLAYAWRKRK